MTGEIGGHRYELAHVGAQLSWGIGEACLEVHKFSTLTKEVAGYRREGVNFSLAAE